MNLDALVASLAGSAARVSRKADPPQSYVRAREIAARVVAPEGKPLAARYDAKAKRGALYLYGDIGDTWFSEGITAKAVAAELESMVGATTLDIYINSPGGSVFEGVSILALLERFEAKKTVYVDGVAASIASVIAMAGDRVVMHRAATMMIHDPLVSVYGEGNAADLREFAVDVLKTASLLDQLAGSIVAAYSAHTGTKTPESKIRDLMLAETWMDAEDAVARGFATEIQAANAMGCECDGPCGSDCPCGGNCNDACECDCAEEPAARAVAPAPVPARAKTPAEVVADARAQAAAARALAVSLANRFPGQPGSTPASRAQ